MWRLVMHDMTPRGCRHSPRTLCLSLITHCMIVCPTIASAALAVTAASAFSSSCQNQGSHVTNWSDPKKALALEKNYASPDVQAQRDAILALAQARPGERCLDVGCGPGFLVEDLARQISSAHTHDERTGPLCSSIIGVDCADAMLKLAEQRLTKARESLPECIELGLMPGDQESLHGVADGTVDLLVLSQVLLYSYDLPKCIATAYRVLKPGGRVVICGTIIVRDQPLNCHAD